MSQGGPDVESTQFLSAAAATASLALAKPSFGTKAASTLNHKERVDRALLGQDVDRPPFTFLSPL